jgi:hypothetical protein
MKRKTMLGCLMVAMVCIACGPSSVAIRTGDAPIGLLELTRLDLLPRFKRSVRVGSFSSYDRTGGNDDGFSGLLAATKYLMIPISICSI